MIVDYEQRYWDEYEGLCMNMFDGIFPLEDMDCERIADLEGIVSRGGRVLLWMDKGRLLGTCTVARLDDEVWCIEKMAVLPESRGRGIGRRLLGACIDHAVSEGAEKVVLTSNRVLHPAIHLYESMGFRERPFCEYTEMYDRADIYMEMDVRPDGRCPA